MWIALLLLCAASVQGQLPEPAIALDFEADPLPAGATMSGETELVPGKLGRAIRFVRAPQKEDPTRLVCKSEGRHCGFPSLIRLQNGELLAHFREGPGHVGHGVIRQIRSTDEGESWSQPVTIFEDPDWDSRSHSTAIQLRSGTILTGFYRHGKGGFVGARVLRSTDGGRTYTPIDLPNPYTDTYVYNIGRPIQLEDGTVLMPLHGAVREDARKATGIIRSTDDGLTWDDFSIIAHGERDYYEANILTLPSGEMLAMNRTGPEPWMWQCRSSDRGHTWTEPENSGMQGDVGELLLLKSGNVMCAYRAQAPGTSDTRASISRDGGRTWVDEIVLDPNGGDHGYTSSIRFPNGRILALNYSTKDGLTQIRSRLLDESAFDNPAPPPMVGYVEVPYSPDLPLRESLTLMAWIKPMGEHQYQRIFWKDGILSLYLSEGRLDGWVRLEATKDARDVVSEQTILVGEWTHVAMTYSPEDPAHQVHLYINGEEATYASVEETTGDGRILPGEKPLFLSSPASQFGLDGLMDEVQVYDVALTAEQIQKLVEGVL